MDVQRADLAVGPSLSGVLVAAVSIVSGAEENTFQEREEKAPPINCMESWRTWDFINVNN